MIFLLLPDTSAVTNRISKLSSVKCGASTFFTNTSDLMGLSLSLSIKSITVKNNLRLTVICLLFCRRGLIMGIWNSHVSVGNIAGSAIAGIWSGDDWYISLTLYCLFYSRLILTFVDNPCRLPQINMCLA